tara:strand:- start:73871 stop:74614 length:744 start_codon:yes stop_codon:yes gene_type:complete
MSKTTMDMSRFGNNVSEAQKKQWMARMKNFLEKTYTLSFNQNESSWKEDVKLDAPGTRGMRWGASNGQGSIYKNFANAEMVEDIESFSKRFRIQEEMAQPQWQMTAETKKIGQYTCYKATLVKADDRITMSNMWRRMRRRGDQKKDSTKTKEDIKTLAVTAWFTPEIPVKTGPAEYYGLPGLILELNAGRTTMLCTEVVLNPEESITIQVPSKGKEVSRDEYNTIIKEKTREMRERFRRGRRGGRRF